MTEFHVGFTGSREGMSQRQTIIVSHALFALCTETERQDHTYWFHEGDCVGADGQAAGIAQNYGYKIWRHPPTEPIVNRALFPFDATDPPFSYSGRNQRIAIVAQVMIATPKNYGKHGGTWNAIGHAKRLGKPLLIVHRDGRWEFTNPDKALKTYLEEHHD